MTQLDIIREKREAILRLAESYGIRRVRIFGSVARGDDRPESDLDVLVDFEPGRSLLDQVGFRQDLEEMLGRRVDVVAEGGISPYLEAASWERLSRYEDRLWLLATESVARTERNLGP